MSGFYGYGQQIARSPEDEDYTPYICNIEAFSSVLTRDGKTVRQGLGTDYAEMLIKRYRRRYGIAGRDLHISWCVRRVV